MGIRADDFFFSTADCLVVGILVTLPLCMLWRVKLPRRQRRMILSIFASSVVLAFAAIFHTVGRVLKIPVILVAGVGSEVPVYFLTTVRDAEV